MEGRELAFAFLIDGDCLNAHDGEGQGGKPCIEVALCAEKGRLILLNGRETREASEGGYLGVVAVEPGENRLVATDAESGAHCEITVYYFPDAVGKFRVSSDDNLLFLRDLTLCPERYASAFDHPYLSVYKQAHDLYGATVQLNLFYSTDEKSLSHFSNAGEYFDLSMMTDRYREEFLANADWFRFSFHANSEYPSKPYQFADGKTVREHCERMHREIVRFAGEGCISDSVTVHWGEASEDCIRELRALGYSSFMGYFEYNSKGEPLVAYNASPRMIDHIGERDFWYDREADVLYGRIDLVLNLRTAEENMRLVREIASHRGRGGFVSLMIHEQYFYEGYVKYLPDFAERVLAPCRYLSELGYRGAQIADVTKGFYGRS